MAAAFKTVEPLEYYRRFLKENCRPDGRELGEFRTTTVNIGSITTADGSALVKLGNTTVICGVKAELAAPAVDSVNKGYIVPNVELPPLCAERFRSGPPGEEAQAASQFIADVIENSQMIVKEDLCIANGKLAWVLYCDIICLDYDGNLLDASVFALLAALKNVQLPLVTINEETGLSEVNLKQKNPLIIRKHPVATSFAVFDEWKSSYRSQASGLYHQSNYKTQRSKEAHRQSNKKYNTQVNKKRALFKNGFVKIVFVTVFTNLLY
ncbi:exosome complex component RRP43 isoform X3 [Ammospiza nelsoni]|uniref:exosome complex component RRP43 isoform X3 n=1 Tax=Ammospiza nelsoni TaxID=2857394 RepID=UPI002869C0A4|nr:exosome complex component RRP43 isoform X3 [Ammospiza nelsoni]